MKSKLNKTLDITLSEGTEELSKVISVQQPLRNLDSVLNKTINGDMFEVCSYLPDNSIDLIIVDPPYNLNKKFDNLNFSKMNKQEYFEYTKSILSVLKSKLKEEGSIYVCCDWQSSMVIGEVLDNLFIVRNRITWKRDKGRGAKGNWKNGHEDIWFATKSNNYTFNVDTVKIKKRVITPYKEKGKPKDWEETPTGNFRVTYPSNLWDDITIPFWSMKENTAHPTQKPEKLIAKLILASSTEDDIILDPFLGSGTTSVVAKKLRRNYIGIEQSQLYCIWTERRLKEVESDLSIQGFKNGVFLDRNMK